MIIWSCDPSEPSTGGHSVWRTNIAGVQVAVRSVSPCSWRVTAEPFLYDHVLTPSGKDEALSAAVDLLAERLRQSLDMIEGVGARDELAAALSQ